MIEGDHEFVHWALDPDRPGWSTPIFDLDGNRVGDPFKIQEHER